MHILHIIGLVGAGKSTFINSFLPFYPCFDVKEIFDTYSYTIHDLQSPSIRYFQFASAFETNMMQFLETHQNLDFVIVESSGINPVVNDFLRTYSHSNILVASKYHIEIYAKRPDAKHLNAMIRCKLKQKKIPIDSIFDWSKNQWLRPLPDILQVKLPELY